MTTDNHDPVNHPKHYCSHASGIECIAVTEHMNFCRGNAMKYICRGNAMKYIWRAGDKGDAIEDLRKARWYLDREIERLSKENGIPTPNTIQSMGGKARNAALSDERKSEIGKKAALARWAKTAIPPNPPKP